MIEKISKTRFKVITTAHCIELYEAGVMKTMTGGDYIYIKDNGEEVKFPILKAIVPGKYHYSGNSKSKKIRRRNKRRRRAHDFAILIC